MANVCPICNNELRQYGKDFYVCEVCETYFDKNENIVLTEQEWLQTATTEQLAEWLAKQCLNAVMASTYDVSELRKKRYWVEWLKQPHKPFS